MDELDRKTLLQMGYASSIGIAMVLAIFGCLYLGNWLDKKLGTIPYFTILFLVIGVVAGFKNFYSLIKKNFKDEEPVIKSLKSEPHRKRPPPAKA
ncbi:MAG: putative F0F1-ATPase [Syntrophaceae bacterium PtaB.Bin095]|nr:MAG: putative F0F1-ATPase [Syntrophaceae bacterium PtaB.Bin095]